MSSRELTKEEVAAITEDWPSAWACSKADERVGGSLVTVMREFMAHLERDGLGTPTRRRHLANLWLLGGEIVRQVQTDQPMRKRPGFLLLVAATQGGEAPLIHDLTEQQQTSVDQTARRLSRFLASKAEHTPAAHRVSDRNRSMEEASKTWSRRRRVRRASILSDTEVIEIKREMARVMPTVAFAAAAVGLDIETTIRFQAISAKCRERRESTGWSIKDVAARLRVPQYRLKAIEDGHVREVEPAILVAYVAHLGLDSWLARWKQANRELAQELGITR